MDTLRVLRKLFVCVISINLFFPHTVFAVRLTNLYQADLPVMSQGDDERAEAVRRGFSDVLIKLASDQNIVTRAEIKSAIKRADYYVQEYNYEAPSTDSSMYQLQVRYETQDINRLLHKSGIPYWGEKRPLLLVWLALSDANHSELIGEETAGDWVGVLKQQSKTLGIPLILPLLDMTDMNQISAQEIVARNLAAMKGAGRRYAPNGFLIGNIIHKEDGMYESQWYLILQDKQWEWTMVDKDLDVAVVAILNEVSQVLVKKFAITKVS